MATRAEHYVEAVRLVKEAARIAESMAGTVISEPQMKGLQFTVTTMTAIAQVHATLASAADRVETAAQYARADHRE